MSNLAVEVAGVSFAYANTNVLTDVNLSVPEGRVYALLGPSGGGKTTLLRLILGRIKLHTGTIKVFGNNKLGHFNRIIGYMPQDQALSLQFTVGETLDYFASIHQSKRQCYLREKETLGHVLQLAEDNHVVGELSGGQQKALSLALALIHKPKIVILDEPTVGTDPVLGHQIWNYLQQLCSDGVTVILVTHYIQEASQADHVGMMREGRIIEEGTPKEIYNKYEDDSLESIFIKISCDGSVHPANKGDENAPTSSPRGELSNDSVHMQTKPRQMSKGSYSMLWLLFILVRRNLHRLLSCKLTAFMLFTPILCTILMCINFKGKQIHLLVSVFNEDVEGHYSIAMQNITKGLGMFVMDYQQVDSLESAIHTVTRGHAIAALHFYPRFSETLKLRILPPGIAMAEEETEEEYRVEGDYVHLSPSVLAASSMKLYTDNSNYFMAQPLMDMLSRGSWELSNKVLQDHKQHAITSPVTVAEVVYARDTQVSDFLVPGYFMAFLYVTQVTLCSQLLILERESGFFDRVIVAGAKHSLMFVSHFATNFMLSIIQVAAMFVVGFHFFAIPNFGSHWLAFTLVVLQSASCIMTGLLISAFFQVNFFAFFVSLAISFIQLFSSGSLFPIVKFDLLRKVMFAASPLALPVQSLRSVMLRGWGLDNLEVAQGLMVTVTTTILFGLLALLFFAKYS